MVEVNFDVGIEIRNAGLTIALYLNHFINVFDAWEKTMNFQSFIVEATNSNKKIKDKILHIQIDGARIAYLIPEDIIRSFLSRIENCWAIYSSFLNDKDLSTIEIHNATNEVKKCICSQLNNLYILNNGIPAGILREYWEKYSCNK